MTSPKQINWIALVPLMGLLAFNLTGFVFDIFGGPRSDVVDIEAAGSLKKQAILGFFFLFAFIVLLKSRAHVFGLIRSNRLLLIFLTYALLSCLWSPVPFISFKRWVQFLGIVLVSFAAVGAGGGLAGIRSLLEKMTAFTIFLAVVLIALHPAPPFIRNGIWWGHFGGPNRLGAAAVLGMAVWLPVLDSPAALKRKLAAAALVFLAIVLVIGCSRATSILATVALFSTYIILSNRISVLFQFLLIAILLIGGSWYIYNFTQQTIVEFSAGVLGRSATLTGRTGLWAGMWNSIKDHFLLGVGYNGFWIGRQGLSVRYVGDFNWANQAHNGYIDILNELGIVGLVFFLFILLQALRRAHQLFRNHITRDPLFFLIISMYAIVNLTETNFCRQTYLGWVMLLLALVASSPYVVSPTGNLQIRQRENLHPARSYSLIEP